MKKKRGNSGQVLVEYAVMLVIAALLGWGLLVLCRSVSYESDEMIELVSEDVP